MLERPGFAGARRLGGAFLARWIGASLLSLAACHAAQAAAQAWPPLASPVAKPGDDAFYTAPSEAELQAAQPGDVLRYREMSAKAYYLFPVKGQAWQLMYRSTDHKGRPVAAVTAALLPSNAPAKNRKLYVYNTAYDALTLNCAPSYQIAKGTALEQALVQSGLNKGWVAVVPDYEGLESLWTVGRNSGQAVLDAIRAAERFQPLGLSGGATPAVLTGYSGGSIASTWANELYRSYAPELNIVGVAAGGVPVDMGNVARKVDGKLFAGLYMGAVSALGRAYPEVDVDALTNEEGKAMQVKLRDMCAGQFLGGTPDVVGSFAFKKMASYTTVPDILAVPAVQQVVALNRLGQRKPGAPTYLYNGLFDQVMPVEDVKGLVTTYCQQGVPTTFRQVLGEHITSVFLGFQGAFDYLEARLAGKAITSTSCK
jgi:hypothetical protein